MADPSIPRLATQHTYPSLNHEHKQQLVIKGKLSSWNQGSIQVLSTSHKAAPCAKGIACGDQLVVQNMHSSSSCSTAEDEIPIAICRHKFTLVGKSFQIYCMMPFFGGQAKSGYGYQGQAMYKFATVVRAPFSSTVHVRFADQASSSSIAYTIHRVGGSERPKKRTVRSNENGNKLAAYIEEQPDSTMLSINAGIDPYLIVCLAAICEELDHQ
jgi:hypothetical protein